MSYNIVHMDKLSAKRIPWFVSGQFREKNSLVKV